jgi:hypothetical protein
MAHSSGSAVLDYLENHGSGYQGIDTFSIKSIKFFCPICKKIVDNLYGHICSENDVFRDNPEA